MNHNDLLFNLYRIETNAVLADDIKETARIAGNILRRQSGAVAVQNVLDAYTVLLQRPDYIGTDTYLTSVTASQGPEHAVALARAEAVEADTTGDDEDDTPDAIDYAVLAVFAGNLNDLNPER
jgi:hypothetical protein